MASKRDPRRPDLVVPFVEPAPSDTPDMAGTMGSTLPMVAIVTRNRMLGWTAVVFALQSFLGETPAKKRNASTPPYFSLLMAFMALGVAYMPLFLPPPVSARGPVPPS